MLLVGVVIGCALASAFWIGVIWIAGYAADPRSPA
jgi:hypothetical protein